MNGEDVPGEGALASSTLSIRPAQAAGIGECPWTRDDVAQWWAKVEADCRIAGDLTWAFIADQDVHGSAPGADDVSVHFPYLGEFEQTHAPALARHTSRMSRVPLGPGA